MELKPFGPVTIKALLRGFYQIWCIRKLVETLIHTQNINGEIDVWSLYLYAMKSPVTRQKYQKRLEKLFDFLKIEGNTIEDKSITL